MSLFNKEMKLFEEIKNKYKPVEGCHLVLDLDAFKAGKEILFKFRVDSEVYKILVNTKYANGSKDCVIITDNGKKSILLDSQILYLDYSIDKNLILEFFDKTPHPYKLKRSLKHEISLLVHDLTHPKPLKPAC